MARFLLISFAAYVLIQLYTPFSIYESVSVSLFVYVMLDFLDNLGKKLVILDVVIITTMLLCLLMPITGYHHFNSLNRISHMWNWYMRVPSDQYYAYMLPATVAMIIGIKLPVFFRKQTFQRHEQYMINAKAYLVNMKYQGLILIIVGLMASFLLKYVPAGISTVIFFVSYLMFVGVFYCLYSSFPNKRIILVAVFGLLIYRSIAEGMFGELVFMSIMTMILVMVGTKMKLITKISLFASAVFFVLVLQAVKPAYREATWGGNVEGSKLSIFTGMLKEKISDPSSLFENETVLFGFYSRFNEGQIISRVIDKVPDRLPYADGETIFKSLAATLVPRFLWPDKPEAGGAYNFERFVGMKLRGYSIGISPFGEAYGNFGATGGIVFMFFFGLLYNFFFHYMLKLATKTPSVILWFPFLFFYAVKIESDVVTMLNSFVKGAIFAYLIYRVFPAVFKQRL